MNKKYFTQQPPGRNQVNSDYWWYDGDISRAATVYEDYELHDIGVVDSAGNKIMAKVEPNEIGYMAAFKRSGADNG